jgi:hypothetical protein
MRETMVAKIGEKHTAKEYLIVILCLKIKNNLKKRVKVCGYNIGHLLCFLCFHTYQNRISVIQQNTMANLWLMFFTIFLLLIPLSFLPHLNAKLIYLSCIVALTVVYFVIKYESYIVEENVEDDFHLPHLYERRGENYRTHSEIMSFATRAEIARWAMRALPAVQRFDSQDIMDCPICMEEFVRGDVIQSFGVCAHKFHAACLRSWLQGGKSTCPVCRLDLFV